VTLTLALFFKQPRWGTRWTSLDPFRFASSSATSAGTSRLWSDQRRAPVRTAVVCAAERS